MKYKFITFEGVEGCGKSTQSKMLNEYFKEQKIATILTREPGGTKVAEEIREILVNGAVNKLDGITEILLNFAARRDHVERLIKPALSDNKVVISDRFFDSTFAYQGFGHLQNLEMIENIKLNAIGKFAPDLTFLINLDVEKSFERIKSRKNNNRYEAMDLDFHRRVQNGFLEIAKKNQDRFRIIDGSKSVEKIHQEIIQNIIW